MKFTAKSSLYVHMKKHEQSEEKITYHCPMDGCHKKYTNKINLRQHIVKHHISSNSDMAHVDVATLLIAGLQSDEEMAAEIQAQVSAVEGKSH